ncbi:MAG: secondary thiamine-phosphate synthase enzyme YjbQ [Candidatus Thermoplasmatota archaeon]|nr:secondary thiamine-phosphate synthase enzyme YjbQ [Candidatus Thermoplasmatota archaeon]
MRVTGNYGTFTEEIWVETKERYQIEPITHKVQEIIQRSGIIDGIVLVNPMHITASVFVNDLEYGLHDDIMSTLERLAPYYGPNGRDGPEYLHHRTGEDNGDAHLRRQLLGHQVTMPISKGRLHLGPWEEIHYAEFDGRRRKRILVKVMGILDEVNQ